MEDEKGFSFLKIITPSCIQQRRLAIPNKFLKKYGKKLSTSVVLKVPSGREWCVELKEDEGKVWFQHGWHEFMEYHSIHVWQPLVFRYQGNSRFFVVILDTTGSEIEYTHNMVEPEITKKKQVDTKGKKKMKLCVDCENDANLEARSTCQKKDGQHTKDDSLGYEKVNLKKNNIGSSQESGYIPQEECDIFGSIFKRSASAAIDSEEVLGETKSCHPFQIKHKESPSSIPETRRRSQLSSARGRNKTALENERALLARTTFTSDNPFCTVAMQPSYVHPRFYLHLPTAFANKYLQDGYKGITLRGVDGVIWRAACSADKPRKVTRGWKRFFVDNHLKLKDVCIFELVDSDNMELKVSIFRAT